MSDNPFTQVEHDASCWRRHAGEFYENRTTILTLRAEVKRLRAQLPDILDAPPRCNGCDLPMWHLGPEPGRWGCSQCGAIHLYPRWEPCQLTDDGRTATHTGPWCGR